MHSIFPHHHHDELSDEEYVSEYQNADDVVDFLKLIFHQDAGEGHLEYFNTSILEFPDFDQEWVQIGTSYSFEYEYIPEIPAEYRPAQNDSLNFTNAYVKNHLALRGPPVIV